MSVSKRLSHCNGNPVRKITYCQSVFRNNCAPFFKSRFEGSCQRVLSTDQRIRA